MLLCIYNDTMPARVFIYQGVIKGWLPKDYVGQQWTYVRLLLQKWCEWL